MLKQLSQRLVVTVSRYAVEEDAQRERREVLHEAIRTASPEWRRFLDRHAHRVQRGGLPTLLALAEAEPASSEIGAAVRAHLAQHPVARPSLVATTRSVRDACVRTLVSLDRPVFDRAHVAPGDTVAYAVYGTLYRFDLVTGEVRTADPVEYASPRWVVAAPGAGPIITVSIDGLVHIWDREKLTAKKGGNVGDSVVGLALSRDGKCLAISTMEALLLADPTGRKARTVIREECTSAPAFDATGARIAVVTSDGTVRIADVASGKVSRTLNTTSHRIEAVAFHPDGRLLASSEQGLEVWDPNTGTRIAALTCPRHGERTSLGVEHIAIAADGRTVVTGGASDDLVVWDLERGGARGTLVTGAMYACGLFLVPEPVTFEHDAARVWDLSTIEAVPPPRKLIKGIAFVDETRLLAVDSREVRLHAATDLAMHSRVETPPWRSGLDHIDVTVSPDGRHVAMWAGAELVVRDAGTLAETWRFITRPGAPDQQPVDEPYEDRSIRAVVFAGPHLAFATAHEPIVRVVGVDGTPVATLTEHGAVPDELLVTANGTLVSRAGADVIVWALDGGKAKVAQRRSIKATISAGLDATAVSPDATRFAVDGTEGCTITTLTTGKVTRNAEEFSHPGKALTFTPDGRTLVGLSGGDMSIRDASTGRRRESKSGLDGHGMRMLPDGKRVIVWSYDTLSLYDIARGDELARWVAAASIHSLAVSPSGALVAIATTVGSLELVRWHDGAPALVIRDAD